VLGLTVTRVSRFLNAGELQRAPGCLDRLSWPHEVQALLPHDP
jgi:hypothetical protein